MKNLTPVQNAIERINETIAICTNKDRLWCYNSIREFLITQLPHERDLLINTRNEGIGKAIEDNSNGVTPIFKDGSKWFFLTYEQDCTIRTIQEAISLCKPGWMKNVLGRYGNKYPNDKIEDVTEVKFKSIRNAGKLQWVNFQELIKQNS